MGIVGFVVIAGVAVLGLIPNRAVSDSASALARRDVAATLSNARTAQRFAPWSDAPDILIGQAQLIAKQRPAAADELCPARPRRNQVTGSPGSGWHT